MPLTMKENENDSAKHKAMISQLFSAIDKMDEKTFVTFLSDGVKFQFANATPIQGRSAVGETVKGFFASIQGLSHSIENFICDGPFLVTQGSVAYTRHDTSQLTVPFVNVFRITEDLIEDYRIYVDVSDLYTY